MSLAGDVQLRAQSHVRIVLAFDDGGQLASGLHEPDCTPCADVPVGEEPFPISLREFAIRTRSSRLEKKGFTVLLGVSLLILPDQVANVFRSHSLFLTLLSACDEEDH